MAGKAVLEGSDTAQRCAANRLWQAPLRGRTQERL